MEGSRPKDAFDPAPPEVPDVHPLAQDRGPGEEPAAPTPDGT
ncbi:hypothetical protein [Streptomyces sp. LS1784]|nr:hypothetical protein [Streptomyces sp. LS1784]